MPSTPSPRVDKVRPSHTWQRYLHRRMTPPSPFPSLPHTVGAEKAPHFVKSLDRDAVYLSPCRVTNRYTVIVPLSSMHCESTCTFT